MRFQDMGIGTLLYIIQAINETTTGLSLRDGIGTDIPVAQWEQKVRDSMADQSFTCECHKDYRPEEDIFNVRAWLKNDQIFSGETGEKIYNIIKQGE